MVVWKARGSLDNFLIFTTECQNMLFEVDKSRRVFNMLLNILESQKLQCQSLRLLEDKNIYSA